jgi:hypothetical protein
MKLQCVLHLVPVAMVSGGCLSPRQQTYTTTLPVSANLDSPEADRLWDSAQDTLREYRFRLDRVDRQEGVITTLPAGSKHFFELWRKDVATREDLWEATVNPLRRWIEVRFKAGEAGGWSELAVVVHKERLSAQDRQFNSTTAAYQYFGDTLPATTGEARLTSTHEHWIDLGRDPALEERLLKRIIDRSASVPPETDG